MDGPPSFVTTHLSWSQVAESILQALTQDFRKQGQDGPLRARFIDGSGRRFFCSSLYPYSECFAARSHPRLRDADRGIKGIAPTSPIDAELRTISIEMVAPHHNNEK